MITTLRRRMGLLFLAFSLLVSISVAATSWTIETQNQDALVINLAGRQRMLIQQMTTETLQIEKGRGEEYISNIASGAAHTFDQTLWALTNGGKVSYLPNRLVEVPATHNPDILTGLQQVHHTWEIFESHLDTIISNEPGSPDFTTAIQAVERLSPHLVQEADEVVRLYEIASVQKIVRLRRIQGIFFGSALGLLIVAFLVTQKSVINPLHRLGSIAERIGGGDLNTPVEVTGPHEIEFLAHNFDAMRVQLKTSREKLESRVAQRTRELTAAFEFSQEIVADFDLDHLLSSVAARARALTQGQATALCLLTPTEEYLELAASSGQTPTQVGLRQLAGRGLTAQVVGAGQTIANEAACINCGFLNAHTPGQCVAAPLRAGERTLGALCVVRSGSDGFSADERRALTLLTNSAAIAITNARLVEAGQRQAEQAASLAERERLAADMHDGLAQTLGFFNMKVAQIGSLISSGQQNQAQNELDRISQVVAATYSQVREAIVGLHQSMTNGSLTRSLAEQIAAFERESGLPVCFTGIAEDEPDVILSPDATGEVLRIVGEAITNAGKHANAHQIKVALQRDVWNETVIITIEDNGRGFDLQKAPSDEQGHFGLGLMRARAKRGGGELQIESAPGQGTRVTLHWPLN